MDRSGASGKSGRIPIGRIVGVHGLNGWLKVHSYCEPREALLDYEQLLVAGREWTGFEGRLHGKGIQLRPSGAERREDVESFIGEELEIDRDKLPELDDGQFYHVDLIGLRVENGAGAVLGTVDRVLPGAGNDALVVVGDRERLIPLTIGHTVLAVDLDQGRLVVDWDENWD